MIHVVDLRRLFRNRFIRLADPNLIEASAIPDGSHLSLFDICRHLQDDVELITPALWKDIDRFAGKNFRVGLVGSPSYGEVARLILWRKKYLEARSGPAAAYLCDRAAMECK